MTAALACLAAPGGGDDDARPSGPAIDDETWMYPPLHAAARAGGSDAKPFEVRFRVNMSRIASVNTIEGTAYVKVSVVFYWDDARLRDWDQFTPLPPKLWGPYLVFENAEGDVVEAQVEFVLVDQRKTPGRLKRTLRFEGKVLNDMPDLQHFPFDYDTVDLHFWTVSGWKCLDCSLAGHRPHGETYRLSPLPVGGSAEGKFHDLRWDGRISEFILFGYSFQNFRSLPDASNQVKSRFVLSYHVARSARYYFLKVLLPLYLIALYGLSVFFFAPTEFASRMSISSTIFLAAFAVLYVVNEALPKTYFLTKIDVVIVATLSLIFLTAVETVTVSALARRDGERGRVRQAGRRVRRRGELGVVRRAQPRRLRARGVAQAREGRVARRGRQLDRSGRGRLPGDRARVRFPRRRTRGEASAVHRARQRGLAAGARCDRKVRVVPYDLLDV